MKAELIIKTVSVTVDGVPFLEYKTAADLCKNPAWKQQGWRVRVGKGTVSYDDATLSKDGYTVNLHRRKALRHELDHPAPRKVRSDTPIELFKAVSEISASAKASFKFE